MILETASMGLATDAVMCTYRIVFFNRRHEVTSFEYSKIQMLTISRGETNEVLDTLSQVLIVWYTWDEWLTSLNALSKVLTMFVLHWLTVVSQVLRLCVDVLTLQVNFSHVKIKFLALHTCSFQRLVLIRYRMPYSIELEWL